jgi:predicted anti-sigma-YlaC factor YlaD
LHLIGGTKGHQFAHRRNKSPVVRDYYAVDCNIAREALSARIDGEREPIPAARVDEHLSGCEPCRQWRASAIEQTQILRRLAGRAQVAAVAPVPPPQPLRPAIRQLQSISWRRWALAGVGVIQVALATAQAFGAHLGVPHTAMGGHLLNESTAWSMALGVVMVITAIRPAAASGLAGVLGAFVAVLGVYVIRDAAAGTVTTDRILSHLPVVAAAVLAFLVWRRDRPGDPQPHSDALPDSAEIILPDNASRGRRRGHLHPTDGSAA